MTARQAALNIVSDVLSKGTFLNLALKDMKGLGSDADQRFAAALASSTLEHLYTIDYVLNQFTQLKKASSRVRNILRLGVCQLLFMDSVPDSAAVNESAALTKRVAPRLVGFVNGVLRNIAREKQKIRMPEREPDFDEYLSATYSYPLWICRLFVAQLGPELAEKVLAYTGIPGRTSLRRTAKAGDTRYPDSEPGIYLDDAFYVLHARNLAEDPYLADGSFTVQSEASMMCVRALGLSPDSKVLDLCAAPGGKSAYAAQIAADGKVVACDVHEHRCRLIEATAKRLGADNIESMVWDASMLNPEWEGAFDAVLVDAPCSALGLMYRKPDIRYSRKEEDLAALAETQARILSCACRYVRPGGTLVYSTCTIDRLENQDVVDAFLDGHPEYAAGNLADFLPGPFVERAASGQIQLLPSVDDIDGFFIARLERAADTAAAL